MPNRLHAETTAAHGRKIASALNLREHMERIVTRFPGASFISTDPPIIKFTDFLSMEECAAVVAAGESSLKPSVGALNSDNGLSRKTHTGRSSFNAWCTGPCATNPSIKAIEARIANATGFSNHNMEPAQILRYTAGQEYHAHLDFIPQQAATPAGPRIFTFFLYLNDVPPGRGGSTWFPHAASTQTRSSVNMQKSQNSGRSRLRSSVSDSDLSGFYAMYAAQKEARAAPSNMSRHGGGGMHELCCSKPLSPAHDVFSAVGLRVRPERGAAIMWPNVELSNVYEKNPKTKHAADEVVGDATKWAANAWIHLRDFRTQPGNM